MLSLRHTAAILATAAAGPALGFDLCAEGNALRGRAEATLDSASATLHAAAGDAAAWASRNAAEARRAARAKWSQTGTSLWGPIVAAHGPHLLITGPEAAGWAPVPVEGALPAHAVVLVHGLDENGFIWDDLAPALTAAGLTVIRFDHANDQALATSADQLAAALQDLHARGLASVDLAGHSMGGLIAREVLTRPGLYGSQAEAAGLPRVGRLITLGSPHAGAPLAYLQPLSEAHEHLTRRLDGCAGAASGWLHSYADGDGEAARDLLPGSAFLTALAERPMPEGVKVTNIVGAVVTDSTRERCVGWTRAAVSDAVGPATAERVAGSVRRLFDAVGDGLVGRRSATLPGVEDTVVVAGDHRAMIKSWDAAGGVAGSVDRPRLTPPAVPVIVDRLAPRGE